jgi:hypothetical protein
MPKNPFEKLVKQVSDQYQSDIIVYIGPIERPHDDGFIERVRAWKSLDNVILILTTHGGDPHAAYRMARCLQEQYQTSPGSDGIGAPSQKTAKGKFRLFVDTRCKSAGTILAAGANILMFSDLGELGPIDVQIRKIEEVGERSSVLTPKHAMESLQVLALHHFQNVFKELRFSEELSFTTKLAAEVAQGLAVGLFQPIYAQIDPMRVGEYDRAMRIASEYGSRLGKSNLKDGALERLVTGYPAHGFVIDKKEAKEIFQEVEEPTNELKTLAGITREWWNADYITANKPLLLYLTTPDVLNKDEEEPNEPANPNAGNAGNAEGKSDTPAAA